MLEIKQQHPSIKLHIFGTFKEDMLKKVKPFSTDASTWALNAARGSIQFWHPTQKKGFTIYMEERERDDNEQNSKSCYKYHKFPHKGELKKFLDEKFQYKYRNLFSAKVRQILNLYYYWQFENYINSLPES